MNFRISEAYGQLISVHRAGSLVYFYLPYWYSDSGPSSPMVLSKLIVGQDNRYSNSKFQVALWFWILLSSYLAIVVFRCIYAGWDFFGRVNIPQNLLILSGLSALTYGGAKAITTSK